MAHFQVDTPENLKALNEYLATNNYVNGDLPGADDVRLFNALKAAPAKDQYVEVYFWYSLLSTFTPQVRDQWTQAAKPAPAKETKPATKAPEPVKKAEDDIDDLFGDDPEAEKKAKEEAEKRKAAAQPKAKKAVIAKTIVIFDVKVYDAENIELLNQIAARIKEQINPEGLVWGKEIQITNVAYTAHKLTMSMIVEDLKVQTDDVFDIILGWEEEVQSVDTVSMQKV
ncbi:hypothetical protein pb186bvf_000204 [Paramecium bursaria]